MSFANLIYLSKVANLGYSCTYTRARWFQSINNLKLFWNFLLFEYSLGFSIVIRVVSLDPSLPPSICIFRCLPKATKGRLR